MEQQLVVFELAGEHYGVDIAAVERIIKMQPITVVPHTAGFVEGVTNLRGNVLPVIDLRKRFGLAQQAAGRHSRIVVVTLGAVKVGMVVDAVSEVLTVDEEIVEPPPTLVLSVDTAFITGIAKIDQRLVILLDLARVLTGEETANLAGRPAAA